jgi:Zn-dependent protease
MAAYNAPMPGSELSEFIQTIAVYVIPLLFGITLHEVAHGWMARRFGDRTAEMLGRLTVNPIKHIDPVGTVIVPLLLVFLKTGFIFGWAKPVPINPRNLKNPKRDMIAVAAAGPVANLVMAVVWILVFKVAEEIGGGPGSVIDFFLRMATIGVFFNILLMLFNLLPIPPLDGGRVLRGLVPESVGYRLDALERYGLIIVLGLIYFGLLSPVIFITYAVMDYVGI